MSEERAAKGKPIGGRGRPGGGTLDYRCRCGELRARIVVEPGDRPRRAVCHCRDCQAFQHALGTAETVLDAHGGTEILMLSPAGLSFARGGEHLAALRLYPKGLLRWYAGCCDTPLGNTPAARRFPHLGLIAAPLRETNGERALTDAAGPVRERIFGADAVGGVPPGAHRKVPFSMIPPTLLALGARLRRGDHRRSPLFDEAGEPVVRPRVFADAERAMLAPYSRV